MTQIRSLAQPVRRRPGELGVHSLDRFNFAVPRIDGRAKVSMRASASTCGKGQGALNIHTHGHPHRWGAVTEGPRKKLQFISFGAFEEDLPRFPSVSSGCGSRASTRRRGSESNGLWFRDPDGTPIEIRVAEKTSPNEKSSFDNASAGPGGAERAQPQPGAAVRPRRLAHMLVFTRDIPRAIKFYGEVLGLRLSDRSGDAIAFMHGIHGSDHHMIAFVKSDAPGLHHLSWDVSSINEIGIGAMQMADKGFAAGWGLGRHVLGSNYFHYVRDPWGSYAEYSSDIDYIPVDHDWKARRSSARGFLLRLGPDAAGGLRVQLRGGGVGRSTRRRRADRAGAGGPSDGEGRGAPGHRSWVSGMVSLASIPFGPKDCSHLAVELALDHRMDELGAEAGASVALGRRAVALLPIQQQGQALIGSLHRQLRSTRPERAERLPYLLALVASSCTAALSPKVGSGSRKTSGPVSDTRSRRRRQQRICRISVSEADLQPLSVMSRCALASAMTRASNFGTSSAMLLRVLGGLREQRQELREQIAGAMTQLADHQLLALIQLARAGWRRAITLATATRNGDIVVAEARRLAVVVGARARHRWPSRPAIGTVSPPTTPC